MRSNHTIFKFASISGWLDNDILLIFGNSLFRPEYRILKTAFENKMPKKIIKRLFEFRDEAMKINVPPCVLIEEWVKNNKNNISDIECNFYESAEDVPDPPDLSSEHENLMIFDHLLLEGSINVNHSIFEGDKAM